MNAKKYFGMIVSLLVLLHTASNAWAAPIISGEMKKWHKITLTFDGPDTSETDTPNPFTDYRLSITFTNGNTTRVVPGYFAADGNAADTGATDGNKWRVHFAPDKTGAWHYAVSFRQGNNVAVTSADGTSWDPLDGTSGSFTIAETDKSGRDNRGKGQLQYVGEHYLKFAETGEYFLKQGADAPENFLAYNDFDNTPDNKGLRKSWAPHVKDWNTNDPTWKNGQGKGIIGAVNYLAAEGMNAFSFIPMNINGDDKNVFPYISDNGADRKRMDCSKLDQWEIVFEHADKMGMFLHFKTQETENELLLDNGNLGTERKLYYRELIARFGHHLALNWNLGEEINNASTAQKKAWAQYFHDTDPYQHHVVIHNGSNHYDLIGVNSTLTGFSLQTNSSDFKNVHSRVKDYLKRSADAGKPWAVACDEPGDASHALRPDNDADNSHEDGRKNGLWGTLLAGGWGNEWYFGYQHAHSDLSCQDFRSRDKWWDYCRYALEFFRITDLPFWQMKNDNNLSSASNDYCFYKQGEAYIVYLKNGGTTNLNLSSVNGMFDVRWYDPRNGGSLQAGTVSQVQGGGNASLGDAPDNRNRDWLVLVTPGSGSNLPPVIDNGPSADPNPVTLPDPVVLSVSATDPEGDRLTYTWSVVSGPGTPVFDPNGTALSDQCDATFNAPGTYVVQLEVSDGELSAKKNITVTVLSSENSLPIAVNDNYSVTADETLNVAAPGVLANDQDADGDPLTSIQETDTDHGQLALNTDGSFNYTPAPGFTGTDTFSYRADDGSSDSPAATVTITVSQKPTGDSAITEFTLINAETDRKITPLGNGVVIDAGRLPTGHINIVATTEPATVGQVKFVLSGATNRNHTESSAPYALWGNIGSDYHNGSLNLGDHTLVATPYVDGVAGDPLTVNFTVSKNPVVKAPTGLVVIGVE